MILSDRGIGMIKRGVCYLILIIISVLVIFLLIGFQSRKLDPEQSALKEEQIKKSGPHLEEIKIVAIRESKSAPKLMEPENIKKKSDNRLVRVMKPSVKKNPNNSALSHEQLKISEKAINSGRSIIDGKGEIPLVQTSDDQIGFDVYLEKMKNMGGRLFIGDAEKQAIIAEAMIHKRGKKFEIESINTSALGQIDVDGLALFRPREIVRESLADEIISKGKSLFGNKDLRCVLMLPLDVEAGILGGLKRYLDDNGYAIDKFDIVWGNYLQSGPEIYLNIHRGRIRGSQQMVSLNLDLTM